MSWISSTWKMTYHECLNPSFKFTFTSSVLALPGSSNASDSSVDFQLCKWEARKAAPRRFRATVRAALCLLSATSTPHRLHPKPSQSPTASPVRCAGSNSAGKKRKRETREKFNSTESRLLRSVFSPIRLSRCLRAFSEH